MALVTNQRFSGGRRALTGALVFAREGTVTLVAVGVEAEVDQAR